ncbi:hypothetical protein T310_7835 [Rasamsonia emersonii CBS 393.64]|uniref:Uncharacterized protein n=1 Tax=Rasamsonia emersonii (strain ATCC 16479 / CBS 393.64 / IMI 116815) TaxID=1408163 RepID=A0A0F4YJE7_RASE3|nr:hypothetical protein T310_7835 [Rasamsonia emersonii CBS 393.64]KKA18225.1 hypothetical protein T310_7835 [Rasamsonia emersonii CBS 393.64]
MFPRKITNILRSKELEQKLSSRNDIATRSETEKRDNPNTKIKDVYKAGHSTGYTAGEYSDLKTASIATVTTQGYPDRDNFHTLKLMNALGSHRRFYPPLKVKVKLSDAWVYVVTPPWARSQFWPADFNSQGDSRQHRAPRSPTIWLIKAAFHTSPYTDQPTLPPTGSLMCCAVIAAPASRSSQILRKALHRAKLGSPSALMQCHHTRDGERNCMVTRPLIPSNARKLYRLTFAASAGQRTSPSRAIFAAPVFHRAHVPRYMYSTFVAGRVFSCSVYPYLFSFCVVYASILCCAALSVLSCPVIWNRRLW